MDFYNEQNLTKNKGYNRKLSTSVMTCFPKPDGGMYEWRTSSLFTNRIFKACLGVNPPLLYVILTKSPSFILLFHFLSVEQCIA